MSKLFQIVNLNKSLHLGCFLEEFLDFPWILCHANKLK